MKKLKVNKLLSARFALVKNEMILRKSLHKIQRISNKTGLRYKGNYLLIFKNNGIRLEVWNKIYTIVIMEHLEGEGIRETIINYFKKFKEWLKPNSTDTLLVQSLKMVYKVLAVLILVAFSPVIIIILFFVFLAAF